MKMHMKNPLWVTNPHAAKREFERELRKMIDVESKCCSNQFARGWLGALCEVLGE